MDQLSPKIFLKEGASSESEQAAVKVPAMVIMFFITMIFGSIPLRVKAFKENKLVLALANAFSGGLFLAVGIIHLLPEAAENFENYYKEGLKPGEEPDGTFIEYNISFFINNIIHYNQKHFPFAFLITVLSFSLVLFIEKIATNHHHSHEVHSARQSFVQSMRASQADVREKLSFSMHSVKYNNKSQIQNKKISQIQGNAIENQTDSDSVQNLMYNQAENIKQMEDDIEEEIVKETLNTHSMLARNISFIDQKRSMAGKQKQIDLTPYLLQIAVGIHALFEGIAIGIQTEWAQCLGIAAAVIGHKWAEAMTLGISFRNADIPIKRSTIFIAIQAIMNPLGVCLGWIMRYQQIFYDNLRRQMNNQGELLTGIFTSISAGTFIYIAALEVIVEEFSLQRYKWIKFLMYLLAIGFVCSLWVFEQLAGGD